MRLSELLFEADAPSGPVPPGMKWNGTMWVPDTTPVKADAPKTDAPKTDSDSPKRKPRSKPFTPQDLLDRAKQRLRRNAKYVKNAEKLIDDKYGWKLKLLFRTLGLLAIITETWATTDVLDEMYQNGEISAEKLEEGREFAWGLFNTAALAPLVVRWTANALLVTKAARILKWLLSFASAPFSLGASIVVAAGTEAFFIWLQKWIVSKDGQKFFETYLFEVIRYFGKPTDATANMLQSAWNKVQGKEGDYYDDAKKRRAEKAPPEDPEGQGGQTAGPPPIAPSKETWPDHIRYEKQNRIFIGGMKVTDDQGKLIPGIQNAIQVQGARAAANTLKLQDPIADIPQRPGEPPIKPVL
jgi:hypothetical protein